MRSWLKLILMMIGSVAPAAMAANEPVMDYGSLLNLRFYDQTGGFMLQRLQMVFPPTDDAPLVVEFVTADGQTIATNALRFQRWPEFPAFAGVAPQGPGIIQLARPGDYLMRFLVGDAVASELPFRLTAAESGDPFNPQTSYSLDGEWSRLAFFALSVDKPDDALNFAWWISLRDIEAATKRPKCSVAIAIGGAILAVSPDVVVSQANPQFFSARLLDPTKRHPFAKADFVAVDGTHEVQIVCDGTTVRSYRATVEGGAIKAHPRSALDYEPHARLLTPRFVDTSAGSSSRYAMTEAWWVEAEP